MRALSSLRGFLELDVSPDADGAMAAQRINRRRLKVFTAVFVVVLLPGLAWDFSRPAEYRATARVQITPGSTAPRPSQSAVGPAEEPSSHAAAELLTQVQVLTSRPLLAQVGEALGRAGHPLAGDPAAQLQAMISALPVAGTEVVELRASGAQPELLAAALNALVDAYREQMKVAYGVAASEGLAQAREEVDLLDRKVRERRERLDAFRSQGGGMSPEREENEAVAQIKGLTTALNTAIERSAVADARLRALRESVAGGKGSSAAKDDPTLAAMEQRASTIREEIRDMERTYTPSFMAMDSQARAKRARLVELEQQIETQRGSSRQAALGAAQEDLASAGATVERLRAQISAQRASMQTFSQRFTQAKALEDDLAQIEHANREALERLARLEASERSRLPVFNLVEAASAPQSPFRPDYLRDALIVLAAAFGFGLLAMWFVELFNRQPARSQASTTVVFPPQWGLPGSATGQIAAVGAGFLPAPDAQHAHDAYNALPMGLLAAQLPPLRELTQAEVHALLTASAGEARFIIAVLLMGLTVSETIALRECDFDAAAGTLRVTGSAPRILTAPAWLAGCRPPTSGGQDAALLPDAAGAAISSADIQSMLACAAFDADLTAAASLTPEVLRHTCIAWLVRQGIRFSDLASLVGRPSADALATYADLAPEGPRLASTEVKLLMPALQEFVG
ncbi:putative Phage integrase [Candidatus Accumulibacter aalborgensis]|uniref:Putative Phage integrase n=1 Tax=Candidatus Accumulibacter aalborgensis TaxID=1860102 RepID=A0A1A8XF54_9PROT|nr:hypothetical protein [Candidatus Accumulibacter aalborgensis]SBT03819.1 putative Phage integrase [Candidatus Accumulibacter aalborgensis]